MYTDIPSLKKCCCCAPLRYGLLAWAYLKLVFYLVLFAMIVVTIFTHVMLIIFAANPWYVIAIYYLVLMLIFSDIIFSIVLIVGAHKKHTTLLRLYFRYGIVHAILIITVGLLGVFYVVIFLGDLNSSTSIHFVTALSSIVSVFLILHTYLLILVRSEILKLKPLGEFQFVNHTSDATCVMQCDNLPPTDEKVLPSSRLNENA